MANVGSRRRSKPAAKPAASLGALGARSRSICPFLCDEGWRIVRSRLRLSRRETAVARLLHEGNGQKQIAVALRLRGPTVHRHLDRIYRKVGVTSEPQLVAAIGRAHAKFLSEFGFPPGCVFNNGIPRQAEPQDAPLVLDPPKALD